MSWVRSQETGEMTDGAAAKGTAMCFRDGLAFSGVSRVGHCFLANSNTHRSMCFARCHSKIRDRLYSLGVPVGIWLSRSGDREIEPGVCASKGLVLASVLAVWGGYRPAVTRGSRLVASSSSLRSACVSLLRRTSPCSVPGPAPRYTNSWVRTHLGQKNGRRRFVARAWSTGAGQAVGHSGECEPCGAAARAGANRVAEGNGSGRRLGE